METSQQRTGVTIAVVAAIVLLFATVALAWFGVEGATIDLPEVGEQEIGVLGLTALDTSEIPGGSLWESTSFLDILVALCTLGTILIGGRALSSSSLSEAGATVLAVLGIVALVLVVYVAIAPPNNIDVDPSELGLGSSTSADEIGPIQVELSRQIGVFVGIVAAAAMTVGGGMAARRSAPR